MRQGPSNRRARGRGSNNSGRRGSLPNRNQTFDSNGPDVRIRGTAIQVNEKYQTLARDASTSGDRVMAENYLQHAEHYHRIILAMNDAHTQAQQQPQQHDQGGRDQGPRQQHSRDNGHRDRDRDRGERDREQPSQAAVAPGDPRDGSRQIEVEFGADPRQDDERDSGPVATSAKPNGAAEAEPAVAKADAAAPAADAKPNGVDGAVAPPRRRRGPGRPRKQPVDTAGDAPTTDGD